MMEEENKNEERGSDEPVASEDILVEVGGDSEVEEVKEEEVIPPEYLPRDNDSLVAAVEVEEVESQSVRDNRVAESLAIYKRQQLEAREKGSNRSAYSQSSTWTAAATPLAVADPSPSPVNGKHNL
jgi:hypothetical protein